MIDALYNGGLNLVEIVASQSRSEERRVGKECRL